MEKMTHLPLVICILWHYIRRNCEAGVHVQQPKLNFSPGRDFSNLLSSLPYIEWGTVVNQDRNRYLAAPAQVF